MRLTHDVAVLGAGFAGALLARLLRRRGHRVLLLEKRSHPRVALGESTTPLANLTLERLAARFDLPDLRDLATWGRLRRRLPHLRRGLKRGFTFYHHTRGALFSNSPENENRLLVAASPGDELADTHWWRADIDHHLVRRAVAEGVDYRDLTHVEGIEIEDTGTRLRGSSLDARVGFVVDAAGALAPLLGLRAHAEASRVRGGFLGGHFTGTRSFVEHARQHGARLPPGPYADEKAAVHHMLEEGWMYVLPFDHGVSSAGLVLREMPPEGNARRIWDEILSGYPTLSATFSGAENLGFHRTERLQYRMANAVGERWALLPHGYAFVGPMFSTGIAWSLLAVERLADVLGGEADLARYDALLAEEAEQIDRLIAAARAAGHDPRLFEGVAHLYFATVSFREIRQRLKLDADAPAWQGFLDADSPAQRELFDECLRFLETAPEAGDFTAWIARAIAPRNVVGLADPSRRRLYGVDFEVLAERSDLLGLRRQELRALQPLLLGSVPA